MNTASLRFLSVALVIVLLASCGESSPSRDPRLPAPEDSAAAARTLVLGLDGMMALRSYHALAELQFGPQRTTLEGDFTPAGIDFFVNRLDGMKYRYRMVQNQPWRSTDGGTTWAKDSANETLAAADLVLGPISPEAQLARQGKPSVVGMDTIAGQEATHIRIAAPSPIDVWVGREKPDGPVGVRRIRSAVDVADPNSYATITYSAFNAPRIIPLPDEAKQNTFQ